MAFPWAMMINNTREGNAFFQDVPATSENLPGWYFFLVTALNAQRNSFCFPNYWAVFRIQRTDRC